MTKIKLKAESRNESSMNFESSFDNIVNERRLSLNDSEISRRKSNKSFEVSQTTVEEIDNNMLFSVNFESTFLKSHPPFDDFTVPYQVRPMSAGSEGALNMLQLEEECKNLCCELSWQSRLNLGS